VNSVRKPLSSPGRTVPVIDLGIAGNGGISELGAVASEIRCALESVGFFVIVNHGVAERLVQDAFTQARRFHAQPLEVKMALRMNEHNNGYMAIARYRVRTSGVNDNDQPDLNEAYFLKRERPVDHPGVRAGRRFVGHNQWPSGLPGFKERVLAYLEAMDALSARMLPAVALALGLESDYFAPHFEDAQFSFRMSHYPPSRPEPNQYGIAPHTDANFMTFVAQSPIAGLQVRLPDTETGENRWVDVPFIERSFAVNAGDMLHRWTNGRFRSTPHRVVAPTDVHRYAIPYFLGPNVDALIECLPTCGSEDRPPRFPPIAYHDYLTWWYDQNYDAGKQMDDSEWLETSSRSTTI